MIINILSCLLLKLRDQRCSCLLVGLRLGDSIVAVDLINVLEDEGSALQPALVATEQLLPHGLTFVGVWSQTQSAALQLLKQKQVMHVLGCLPDASSKQPGWRGQSPTLGLPAVLAYGQDPTSSMHNIVLGAPASETSLPPPTPPRLMPSQPDQPLAWIGELGLRLVRCRATLQLSVFTHSNDAGKQEDSWQQAVTAAFRELEDQVLDPQVLFVITGSDGARVTSSSPGTVHDLPSDLHSPCEAAAVMLRDSETSAQEGLAFEYRAAEPSCCGPMQQQSCTVELDVLMYVADGLPLGELATAACRPALLAQLAAWAATARAGAGKVRRLAARHFLPPGRLHHVSVLRPVSAPEPEADEAAAAPLRRHLHAALGLPLDRPALRDGNALAWGAAAPSAAAAGTERLRDVHLGLPAPGPAGAGAVHLLHGSYEYFHYMQDRFDDSGWGCAYRSLQTLCSWFRLQRYTSKPSPSHRQIQAALVAMGDKERSFEGSSQWIGAIELSYVLDAYLGVSCKVLTVNRGADIPSHARELAAHFDSQGTPVMIGGGVLAYTLLGVYFDEGSGDCAFLILDPHYKGGESLAAIQKGAWVGWKRAGEMAAAGGPLFVQDAFYNFLCPQRPKEV